MQHRGVMKKRISQFQKFSVVFLCIVFWGVGGVHAWQSDNGDGTFTNPVLYADYPDPDIIRVGEDFYMVSTTFVDSPGITVLHSQDLVNWEILSHAAELVDGPDSCSMIGGTAYRGGFWASSIRYHGGIFYIAVQPTFANGRIYYAANPAGPWNYYQLARNIYDPGLFFDTDGTGYIICGHGPQSVMTLNSTYSAIVSQADNLIDSGGEGSHVVKRGNYYYLFNANPGVWPFQLRCSRATNIFGPWETGHICLTAVTGGHQGAIVDIDDNDNWFGFVHQDSGAVGRMPRLGPVFWENDWPVFGTPNNRDVLASTYTKPIQGKPLLQPPTSDDFSSSTLGLQWQWNHNPDNTRWSLTERPGFLRLRPTQADSFWTARNTLTQKGQGPQSHAIVKLDISQLQDGDRAGFGTLGKVNGYIYVADSDGKKTLGMVVDNRGVGTYTYASNVPFSGTTLYLRTDLDFQTNQGNCSYSVDGTNWTSLGGYFPLEFDIVYGTFQGEKYAVFCFNPYTASSPGYVDVDSFTFGTTANPVNVERGRPILNSAGTTFAADNGNRLRGPFASTEWGNPPSLSTIESIKNLGCNAIHLYGECFDMNYPAQGSTAPGYAVSRIDQMVDMTRQAGLYLIITIGNGANNGNFNYDYVMDFWRFYAPRYKDQPHVIYEIQNEPHAWSAPYPQAALDMEADAYTLIRSLAPDTPILLFSFAVLGSGSLAVADIQAVSAAASVDWSKAAVAFHGYAGHQATAASLETILNAGYPCFMTEFTAPRWGSTIDCLDAELTAELERLEVSWLTFQHIPPNFIGSAVTDPAAFCDIVNNAGLSWLPDYGTWPVLRGVYSSDSRPWTTTGLSGTLRIQAEDFDTGGQGVAYSDADAANQGGQYRLNEGVDIEITSDSGGGYNVGWIDDGEWLEYTIFVKEPGFYTLDLRVAGPNDGCTVQVFCGGRDKTGQWSVPNTGGWQSWTTISRSVFLEYGRQKMRLEMPAGWFNLNWIQLTPAAAGTIANGTYKFLNRNSAMAAEADTVSSKVVQNPYSGTSVQKWTVQHRGAGQYSIVSAANGSSWSTFYDRNGEPLTLAGWGYDGSKDRRFLIIPTDNGYCRFAVADGGLCIEIAGASLAAGAAAQQYEYTGGSHQQWGILVPSAPAFPAGLNARWLSSSRIQLTWTASDGAISYNIKRSAVSGGPYTTIAENITATSYSDTDVAAGTRYYYVVSANTAAGESLISNEASPPNLHAYWKFDETSGTDASDASGNGWTAALVNGAFWSAGKFGNAVDLDGTNDYVSLPAGIVEGLTDFTVSAWVYLDAVSTWSRIFDFGTGTSVNMFLTPRSGSGTVRFAVTTSGAGGEQQINGSAALPAGIWTHIVVTLAGGTGILYVNGEEAGRSSSMTLTPSSLGRTTQNYIGRSQYSADTYLKGCVDEFRIYADALSAAEVAALYAEQIPVIPPPPTSLTAVAVSSSQIDLTWTPSAGAAGYNIKRSTVSGGPYTLIAANVTTPTFSDVGLSEATTYYYVVSAVNSAGESADSAQAEAATLDSAPAAPSGLTAAVGNGFVRLAWAANTESDLAGYHVYRSMTSANGFIRLNSALLSAPEYLDTEVSNYITYFYAVSAVDRHGNESSYSEAVKAMPYDDGLVILSAADFESGFGDWVNITDEDTHDWIRHSGTTLTPNTGPNGGANGSTWYIYLETSPGYANQAGNTAILESPLIYGSERVLIFSYHMYGIEIGTLAVDIYDGTWHYGIWSRSSQQHNSINEEYTQAFVDLRGYTGPIRIRFRAVAAGGPRGDIAIDEIAVLGRRLYGDMNDDSIVGIDDLTEFAALWLQNNCTFDLNGDCRIDLYEFAEFAANWMAD